MALRLFNKRYHPPGTEPGTLHTQPGTENAPLTLHLIDYSTTELHEIAQPDLDTISARLNADSFTWLRVNGVPDANWMRGFGSLIDLHPLAQEDILNGDRKSVV